MSKKSLEISPETEEILAKMGEQIKLARLRRRIPAEILAYKAGISGQLCGPWRRDRLLSRSESTPPFCTLWTTWIRIF